jgi:superfamily II DNA or RNA helicase
MQIRFDRGTILVDASCAGVDPAALPGVEWDPRVRSWRAPADAYAAVVERLAHAEIPFESGMPEHETASSGWTSPDLRWYQREALAAWGAANRRGVIALPTGVGKTIIAVAAIARCGVSALCLVPTRVLLDQWAKLLTRYLREVGRLGDGERSIAPVTVATYASAITWAPKIGDRFGLVIIDEAHHVGAECPADVLEMLVAAARLGLTATPPLGDAALALERHVGPVVYTLAVDDLVGDALADFDLVTIPIRLSLDERARYDAARQLFGSAYASYLRASPGGDWKAFVTAAMRSEDGRRALAASKDIIAYPDDKRRVLRELLVRHANQRTIVFTQDNRTAYEIARQFLVYPITHEIGRKERARVLDRFNAGDINAIVSAQVLDEGLDVPEAEVATVVGGTASSRRHVQRIGRVLRPTPGKRARVYELTVSDTIEVEHVRRRRRGIRGAPEVGTNQAARQRPSSVGEISL